ncbi:MAG: bifunctional DNA-binding transcriptional regulator/O6-methylguanine-DNA methyltransferase Ada [Rhodospirillaceae bacterium]|nr:bifunctional DNA-binding transcriptional regulator/O6-methylguanine-DNA methyltransferase Ada [Rhodospirillaceae bacterium]
MTDSNFGKHEINTDRWTMVLERDIAGDGKFVYAVVTTGIYCRPSCSSRRPSPANVRYFDLPEAAEKAGYRACRKCGGQPESQSPEAQMVERVCRFLDAADEKAPSLAELSAEAGISPHHLQRRFKARVGVSPRQYWDARRVDRLKHGLKSGETVTPALYDAGYGSSSRLYEKSDAFLGMTPASYGKGGAGAVIAHATAETPLGLVLVGATAKGVCFVAIGADEPALVAELAGDFPKAELAADETGLGGMLDHVVAHLEGREPDLSLPLDIRATAFQRQVWQALTEIPYGETRSYAELASSVGKPQAPRAVGRACASNPVSLLVPCHRAVGSDGSLTGYRWGTERKRDLLAQESRFAAGED